MVETLFLEKKLIRRKDVLYKNQDLRLQGPLKDIVHEDQNTHIYIYRDGARILDLGGGAQNKSEPQEIKSKILPSNTS